MINQKKKSNICSVFLVVGEQGTNETEPLINQWAGTKFTTIQVPKGKKCYHSAEFKHLRILDKN